MAHSHHGHGHGHGGHPHGGPHVGGMSRAQFSKIVFPSALSIIIFIAYSILVHIFSLSLDTRDMPIDGIIFCIFWTLLISSFLRGAFTSPGLVQKGWYKRYPDMYNTLKIRFNTYKQQIEQQKKWMKRFTKDNDDNESTNLLMPDDDDDDEKEIEFPDNFARPPRSHYCSELNGNILRMDHFCVWFNNAVGFYNYKYFLLTLIYLFLSCLISLHIIIYRTFINKLDGSGYGALRIICLLLSFIICIFFIVFTSMHLYLHLWQLTKNLTSIEYHKYISLKSMSNHFQIAFVNTHEFDDGMYLNCKKMLGNDIWFWFLPIAPSLPEDGYRFHINVENKNKIENLTRSIQKSREDLWKKSKLGKQSKVQKLVKK